MSEQNKGILITICMPVYNEVETIDSSINSVLNQSYKNIELLISDNCSTDGTFERLQKYKDPRIKLFQNKKNIGWRLNSNQLLARASGTYVVTLHGDDVYKSHAFLERILQLFEENENAGVIHFIPSKDFQVVFKNKNKMNPEEYYSFIGSLRYMPPPTMTTYRNDAIKGTGHYIVDDWTGEARLSLQIAERGYEALLEENHYIERGSGLTAERKERLDPSYLKEQRYSQRYRFYTEHKTDPKIKGTDLLYLLEWMKKLKNKI
ncbi:glycosyltransferase family 2 protein [Peribacillus frigoritolerans]|uniref:glycosyltransferase family 2 protein n=1 Tax=Peribacillus frigoritolerans TaxID=450367 RepID=UPI002ED3D98C|nr:glycosyltransferase family 2 protein [Peribacillus frigoritolerans]